MEKATQRVFCLDTKVSAYACGACEKECGGDEVCVSGQCQTCGGVPDETECKSGDPEALGIGRCCSGRCASVHDAGNCGLCRNMCGPNRLCYGGACLKTCVTAPDRSPCNLRFNTLTTDTESGRCCDGRCVDLKKDPENCGSCRDSCSLDSSCQNGRCRERCRAGQVSCGMHPDGYNVCCPIEARERCMSCGSTPVCALSRGFANEGSPVCCGTTYYYPNWESCCPLPGGRMAACRGPCCGNLCCRLDERCVNGACSP